MTRLPALFALILTLTCAWPLSAAEPYPFEVPPRDVETETWLDVDFESGAPQLATLGTGAAIEPRLGTDGSNGLVIRGGGEKSIIKIPIPKYEVGISRFELAIDYGGQGFTYFRARLNAYNKQGEVFRSANFPSGAYGYSSNMNTLEARLLNMEFEKIYAVELELLQSEPLDDPPSDGERLLRIDNIVLKRHDERVVYGDRARRDLELAISREGGNITELGDLIIADFPKRKSYFNFGRIDEKKRFVRSQWQQRLHIGTTYRESVGKLPTFLLGVSARQSRLEAAAAQQKKSLVEMYEFFLDDVAAHGFNTVAVDFTKELDKFDALASARNISVIIRDPSWSGLEKWVANPKGPLPEEFKKAAAENMAKYAEMKSLLGYHMNRPLSTTYEPMLAKAREYLASIQPGVQLITQESNIYSAEKIAKPYPNIGLQRAAFHHYLGRPWAQPSHMYHPNYWPRAITEGYYRRILSAYRVRTIPTVIEVPTGREFQKKSINMQQDRVVTSVTNWKYNEETKRWSGWYRYNYPPNMLRCLVWKAIESGAGGVIFDEWGPATIAGDVTGSQILADSKYANGSYQPETLRRADMSESDGWKELGQVARELAGFRHMLADTTLHGNNTTRVNNSNIRVSNFTGLDSPFKVLMVVNTKIGEYAEEELVIDPETGNLQGYAPAIGETFEVTLTNDTGLIDFRTGTTIAPKSTDLKDRTSKYELSLAPGEGRFYFRGRQALFLNFIDKYQVPVGKERAQAAN